MRAASDGSGTLARDLLRNLATILRILATMSNFRIGRSVEPKNKAVHAGEFHAFQGRA
jgi:hypothetical protein